ncbi:MAG: hypothetical protein J5542_10215 [Bacteroidales bacterium]|nr:hypothetical protein [Bacteroidales bacterium]
MKLFREILLIIFSASIIVSCSGSKNLATEEKTTASSSLPCAEKGISDADFFRACADATSSNIGLAREKAMAEAKSSLGKAIIDKVLTAAKHYIVEENVSDKDAFVKNIEIVSNKAIDIALKDISPVCEKYSETNGRYTAYVAVEISRQTINDKLKRIIENDIPNVDMEKFGVLFCGSPK